MALYAWHAVFGDTKGKQNKDERNPNKGGI